MREQVGMTGVNGLLVTLVKDSITWKAICSFWRLKQTEGTNTGCYDWTDSSDDI